MSAFAGVLLDEHIPHALKLAIDRRASGLPVYLIGDGTAPPTGTPDPDLLIWLEVERCILLTANRASMPGHLADHPLQGRHVPGIVRVDENFPIGGVADALIFLWEAAEETDLADRITPAPL